MGKKINYNVKEAIVTLSGTCFWYWNSFYSFLDSCGVQKSQYNKYSKEIHSKYTVMRNILEHLEEIGKEEVINNIISTFYRMKTPVDRDVSDEEKAKHLLKEFRELVGDDPIEKEIIRRKKEEHRKSYLTSIDEVVGKNKRLGELEKSFNQLFTSSDFSAQERGYKFENLFCDILQLNEIEYSRPYKSTGEQIDGHFRYEKFDYLIETKWLQGQVKQLDFSAFDGKIRGKAQSTRGLFLAANGFDENAIAKFSGDSPRIILMTGEDLAMILNGRVLFHDAMRAKIDAIVKHGNIHFPIRKIAI